MHSKDGTVVTVSPRASTRIDNRAASLNPLLRGARLVWIDGVPEDNKPPQAVVEGWFEHDVDVALITAQALDRMRRHIYDAVVTDLKRKGSLPGAFRLFDGLPPDHPSWSTQANSRTAQPHSNPVSILTMKNSSPARTNPRSAGTDPSTASRPEIVSWKSTTCSCRARPCYYRPIRRTAEPHHGCAGAAAVVSSSSRVVATTAGTVAQAPVGHPLSSSPKRLRR